MLKRTIEGLASLFSISDEQAMWRVQQEADPHAFAVLVDRWRDRIHALCARMTGNAHTAEDLAQEAFARIFDKRADYHPAQRFSTWLWRIALNLCYDELRRAHRRQETALGPEDAEAVRLEVVDAATPRTSLQQREEAELVRRALLQLPEIYRSVLVLRHYENLKLREIAEVLEIPEGTVNSRLAEGLAQLTRLLEPEFGDHSTVLQPKPLPANAKAHFAL
jgi:RNA polymerase sigma-70 factor (ECF subfamily)